MTTWGKHRREGGRKGGKEGRNSIETYFFDISMPNPSSLPPSLFPSLYIRPLAVDISSGSHQARNWEVCLMLLLMGNVFMRRLPQVCTCPPSLPTSLPPLLLICKVSISPLNACSFLRFSFPPSDSHNPPPPPLLAGVLSYPHRCHHGRPLHPRGHHIRRAPGLPSTKDQVSPLLLVLPLPRPPTSFAPHAPPPSLPPSLPSSFQFFGAPHQ